MKIIVFILSIFIFIKTLSYGIYEIKEKNKSGGIIVIITATLSLILPILMMYLREV